MKKNVLLLFFMLAFLFCSFSVPVAAEIKTGSCGDKGSNVTYAFDTETKVLILNGTGGIKDHDNHDYGLRPPWYSWDILKITIDEGVTRIGSFAFAGCYSLEAISIPSSVTSLGDAFLRGCNSIITVHPDNAFYRAEDGILFDKSMTKLIWYPKGKGTSYVMPEGVKTIGNYAFFGSDLNYVTIPDGVTGIGNNSFYGSKLKSVVIPGSVEVIGPDAFHTSYDLSSVELNNGTRIIGKCAFRHTSLRSVDIPSSVTSIGYGAFVCSLTSVTFSEGLKTIGAQAFEGCRFTSLTIPSSVTNIDSWAFQDCKALTSVYVGGGNVGEKAFAGCDNIERLTLAEGVTSISAEAFKGAGSENLKTLVLPNSVTSVGGEAFVSFGGGKLETLIIGSGVKSWSSSALNNCPNLKYIDVNDSNHYYYDYEGVFYAKDGPLVKYPPMKNGIYYTVKDGTKSIGTYAFKNVSKLQGIILPNSVITIGGEAFYGCAELRSIKLEDGVKTIGSSSFSGCKNLRTVSLPDSVTVIEKAAFSGCTNLIEISLGEGLTRVKSDVFTNCVNLKELVFPDGIKQIGRDSYIDDLPIGKRYFACMRNGPALRKVVIPVSATEIYSEDRYWSEQWKYSLFPYCDNIVIYGDPDSQAERVATQQKIPFVDRSKVYEKNAGYTIKVVDDNTGKPLKDAEITHKDGSYKTGADGTVKFTADHNYLFDIKISKDNYVAKDSGTVYLQPNGITTLRMVYSTASINSSLIPSVTGLNDVLNGPAVSLLGCDFPAFTMNIGLNIPLMENMKIINDEKDKTMKVLIGVDESLSTADDNKYWSRAYNDIKNLNKKYNGKETNTTKLWNDFSVVRGKLKRFSPHAVFSCSGSVAGYIEYSYATGELVYKEGGIMLELSADATVKQPFAAAPIVYYAFGVTGDMATSLGLAQLGDGTFDRNMQLKVGLDGHGGLGIGAIGIAGVEGGVKARFTGSLETMREDLLRLDFTGSVYFKYILNGKEAEPFSRTFADYQLYPNIQSNKANMLLSQMSIVGTQRETSMDIDAMENIPRNYRQTQQRFALRSQGAHSTATFQQKDIYPYSEPQYVELSNGNRMLLWITDNTERSDINRTMLMYAIYDGGIWSDPMAILDNGTADYAPKTVQSGDNVYLVWQKNNSILEDTATASAMIADMDLMYSSFEDGEWTTPIAVTKKNSIYETSHKLYVKDGAAHLAWIENSGNDTVLATGTNTVKTNTVTNGALGDVSIVTSTENVVNSLAVGEQNSIITYGITMDNDGDLTTGGDSEVYLYRDGSEIRITEDEKDDLNLQFMDGAFYWYGNNALYTLGADNGQAAVGINCGYDFQVVSQGGHKSVIWTVADGYRSEIYAANYQGGTWTPGVPVTGYGNYVRGLSAVMKGNGEVGYAFNSVQVNDDFADGESPYGITDMVVIDTVETLDSIVDKALTFDAATVVPNVTAAFSANITNNSVKPITQCNLTLSDSSGTVLASQMVDVAVAVGETSEVSLEYTIPEVLQYTALELLVEPADWQDTDLTNNIVRGEIGFADLTFSEAEIVTTFNGGTINATIKNIGYEPAVNNTVQIYQNGLEGELLGALTISDLPPDGTAVISYDIAQKCLVFDNENTENVFYLEVTSDSEENDLANNGIQLLIGTTHVASVTLDKKTLSLDKGESASLIATVGPADAFNKNITWLSNDVNVATVSDDGTVSAVGGGIARISASSIDGSVTDICEVSVLSEINSISLNQNIAMLQKSGALQLTATIQPADANNQKVTWSSDKESVATVDNSGFVQAMGKGIANITVTTEDGDKSAFCTVTVTPLPVDEIVFNKSIMVLIHGDSETLMANLFPANADYEELTWESDDEDIVTVSSDGTVTAQGIGTAIVKVTEVESGKSSTCSVTVNPRYVESVSLSPREVSVNVNATFKLQAMVLPFNATDKSVTWETDNDEIATVIDGIVTGMAKGTTIITITTADGGYTDTCSITVLLPVSSVALKESISLELGEIETLTPIISPAEASNQNVSWSSDNEDVATVTDGIVRAKKAGTAYITVTTEDGNKMATCKVIVMEPVIAVTSVSLNKESLDLLVECSETLTAVIAPENATNKAVNWNSDNTNVATVDENGKVTAVAPGATNITVTSENGGKTAVCAVTVTAPVVAVTGVSLNKGSVNLLVGDFETLTATIAPENATNKAVNWNSDNTNVATVGENGKVTAVAPGAANITVTSEDGGKTAVCAVTVTAPVIVVTGVSLNKGSMNLLVGDFETLTATMAPENATNKAVNWNSDNTNVATVDENGKVTAVAPGAANITVTSEDGGKTAVCAVTVTAPVVAVTGANLNKASLELLVGGSATLTAAVTPENATNKTVSWSSANHSVATVDNAGKVTAVAPGTANITATSQDGGKKAVCIVTVTEPATDIAVTGVSLNKENLELLVGGSETLASAITPENATNKAVSWSSDNAGVATVDGNGKVITVSPGIANISVTTADGNKTAACKVTVRNPAIHFDDIPADVWYEEYVDDLVSLGILNGKSEGKFDPQGKITRAEFAKILAYASGDDLALYDKECVFGDSRNHWSKKNINWAYEHQIVKGKGGGFAPNANISRQEMAVMIKRYADYKGITLPKKVAAVVFNDAAKIASWAKAEVTAMQQATVIGGKPGNLFDPEGNALRCEAAKMISVFLSL